MDFWNAIIAALVCSVAASVAYLCYFAVRLWGGNWKPFAIAPLVVLAAWVGFVVLGVVIGREPRTLWPFELLAWSMVTAVYLVVLFTAKRTFDKADAVESPSAGKKEP